MDKSSEIARERAITLPLIQCDLLIVTVTRVEILAVLAAAGFSPENCPVHEGEDKCYHDLGQIGSRRVLAVQCEMGMVSVGGAVSTVLHAIDEVQPKAVVMVGIAFGFSEESQQIGQILVSKQIQGYELQRIGTTEAGTLEATLRGDKAAASEKLLSILKTSELRWGGSKVKFGLIMSGEKLVDNLSFRNSLRQLSSEAVGGDMESFGVYVACHKKKVDWIIVKAICDFADGDKRNDKTPRQEFAAKNAATFVIAALRGRLLPADGGSFPIQSNKVIGSDVEKVITPSSATEGSESKPDWSIDTDENPGRATARINVRKLPTPYVARTRENERIGKQLWNLKRFRRSPPLALVGAAGFGKSVIASAVSRANVIGTMYPKGIVCLDSLTDSSLCNSISNAIRGLTDNDYTAVKISDGLAELFSLIEGKETLVILDNLNSKELAKLFCPYASDYALLLTTHNRSVVKQLQCRAWEMHGMTTKEAVRLLARSGQLRVNRPLYEKLRSVVSNCGKVPEVINSLGLLLIGRSPSRVKQLLDLAENNQGPFRDLSSVLFDSTTSELTAIELKKFGDFAVFDPNETIPECVIDLLLSDGQLQQDSLSTLDRFVDLNLLRYYEHQNGYRINQIHHMELASRRGNKALLHDRVASAYLKRHGSWSAVPLDGYFERKILIHLEKAGRRKEMQEVASHLLSCPNEIGPEVVSWCFKLLGAGASDQALTILSATDNPVIQQRCVAFLGKKSYGHAKRLLRSSKDEILLATCLSIVGSEAKEDARRLLKPNANPHLVLACLDLMPKVSDSTLKQLFDTSNHLDVGVRCVQRLRGQLQIESAIELYKRTWNPSALIECVKICGERVRERTEYLLENHPNANVRTACLKLLGLNDKKFARRFMKESEDDCILCYCLDRLRDEAKPLARRLVKQNRDFQLTCKALRILGNDGREEARYLLKESNDPRILLKCLRILSGPEAERYARQLLARTLSGDLDDLVASRCLQILGEEAKVAASSLIKTTNKPEVLMACVDVLGPHGDVSVYEVAENTENEMVAKKCIEHLRVDALDLARTWYEKAKNAQTIELCRKVIRESSSN